MHDFSFFSNACFALLPLMQGWVNLFQFLTVSHFPSLKFYLFVCLLHLYSTFPSRSSTNILLLVTLYSVFSPQMLSTFVFVTSLCETRNYFTSVHFPLSHTPSLSIHSQHGLRVGPINPNRKNELECHQQLCLEYYNQRGHLISEIKLYALQKVNPVDIGLVKRITKRGGWVIFYI